MASDAQIAANRRNAENSTGPRTPEGKEQSRRNALRHGLAAEHVLLVDEDPDDFRRFNEAMRAALAPEGEAEDVLADRIVLGNWRLRRVWRTEAAAINEEAIRIAHEHAREEMREHVLAELRENPPEPPKDLKPWESPPTLASIAYQVVSNLTNAQIEEAVTLASAASGAEVLGYFRTATRCQIGAKLCQIARAATHPRARTPPGPPPRGGCARARSCDAADATAAPRKSQIRGTNPICGPAAAASGRAKHDRASVTPHPNPPPRGGRGFCGKFNCCRNEFPPPSRGRAGWGVRAR